MNALSKNEVLPRSDESSRLENDVDRSDIPGRGYLTRTKREARDEEASTEEGTGIRI